MKNVALLALAVFIPTPAMAGRNKGAAPPPAPVVVAKAVHTSEVFDSLIYPARLVSKVNATVLAESDGVVKEIRQPLGSRVEHGTTVFVLMNPDPVYHFAPLEVYSPVPGVVSGVDVAEGSRVTKGQKLGTVTDPKQVRAQIEITVVDLSSLHVGMPGELEIAGAKGPIPMKIRGISPLIDPVTGTASAELVLANPKSRAILPPGLVGRIRFRARLHQGLEIPESAIFYRGTAPLVRVIEDEKAVFRPVKLGPSRQGKYEILEGLNAGETVVLRANTFISGGEKVTIQRPDGEGT